VSTSLSNVEELADRWFVTNGVVAVGPVSYDLLVRGVAHGKIPVDSFVRHASWNVWRRLDELEGLNRDGLHETVRKLAIVSARLDDRASGPQSVPPPPPSREQLVAQAREERAPTTRPPARASRRPPAVDPVGVLGQAISLDDALLLTLSTAVTAAAAEVGLLHRWRSDLGGLVTTFGHGPDTEALLGERMADSDPTLAAARIGRTVISEPECGEVGRYIAGRIGRCLAMPGGLSMVPLCVHGELAVVVELGRAEPFRAREIARVEDVLATLGERAVVMGWLES
jgi:hypothetical protein